jgi:hypothetical protein
MPAMTGPADTKASPSIKPDEILFMFTSELPCFNAYAQILDSIKNCSTNTRRHFIRDYAISVPLNMEHDALRPQGLEQKWERLNKLQTGDE